MEVSRRESSQSRSVSCSPRDCRTVGGGTGSTVRTKLVGSVWNRSWVWSCMVIIFKTERAAAGGNSTCAVDAAERMKMVDFDTLKSGAGFMQLEQETSFFNIFDSARSREGREESFSARCHRSSDVSSSKCPQHMQKQRKMYDVQRTVNGLYTGAASVRWPKCPGHSLVLPQVRQGCPRNDPSLGSFRSAATEDISTGQAEARRISFASQISS